MRVRDKQRPLKTSSAEGRNLSKRKLKKIQAFSCSNQEKAKTREDR